VKDCEKWISAAQENDTSLGENGKTLHAVRKYGITKQRRQEGVEPGSRREKTTLHAEREAASIKTRTMLKSYD
jgi:hypothetical protein